MIDETDAQILAILQSDARTSNAAIAREVGLTASAIHERIKKLQARGVIRGFEARLCPREVGIGLLAFVEVVTDEVAGTTSAGAQLAAIPGVQEVHHIAGEDCYLIKVRVASAEALGDLLREKVGAIGAVRRTRSTIVMSTLHETACLPLEQAIECPGGEEGR
ncbi:MAG: Lrp/AsnC family transcriptional regulator [Gemmatimonadota bacterium]